MKNSTRIILASVAGVIFGLGIVLGLYFFAVKNSNTEERSGTEESHQIQESNINAGSSAESEPSEISLFPAQYLEKTRDINRMKAIQNIAMGLAVYFVDNDSYPAQTESGCVSAEDLDNILVKIPVDTLKTHINTGCIKEGEFGYATVLKDGKNIAVIGATMEDEKNGNSDISIEEIRENPEKIYDVKIDSKKGKYYLYVLD